jgi:hypothetical protein
MGVEVLSTLFADEEGWRAFARVRLVQELVFAPLSLGFREDAALVFEEDLS